MISQTIGVDDDSVLLLEFNHRLFNTLQIICAGIAKCGRLDAEDTIRPHLHALADRIQALAGLHRLLSLPQPIVLLEDYCRSLSINLVQAFGREDVTPWVQMDDAAFTPAQCLKTGLMVVELVTNAVKHSLHSEGGVIWIRLGVTSGWAELSVCDSRHAPGAPAHVPRILAALAESLGGEAFAIDSDGFCAGARFPLEPRLRAIAERRTFRADDGEMSASTAAARSKAWFSAAVKTHPQ